MVRTQNPNYSGNRNKEIFVMVILIIGGCYLFYVSVIKPMQQTKSAQSWQETPCKILVSEVETIPATKSQNTNYRARIIFTYTIAGQEHKGRQYDFSIDTSTDHHAKEEIVRSN